MEKTKGMLVNVLRDSNGGSTHYINRFHRAKTMLIIGEGIPEVFEADNNTPVGFLKQGALGRLIITPDVSRTDFAFGGAFVYSSDSRFPSNQPIHIHDRDLRLES